MGKVYDDIEVIGVVTPAQATRNAATYATVAGASITIPANNVDPSQAATAEYIRVTVGCKLTKATGGTGTIGISVNGAAPAAYTERTVDQAVAGGILPSVGMSFLVLRPAGTAIVVALQAKCSDTNVLTLDAISMSVERVRTPGGLG